MPSVLSQVYFYDCLHPFAKPYGLRKLNIKKLKTNFVIGKN